MTAILYKQISFSSQCPYNYYVTKYKTAVVAIECNAPLDLSNLINKNPFLCPPPSFIASLFSILKSISTTYRQNACFNQIPLNEGTELKIVTPVKVTVIVVLRVSYFSAIGSALTTIRAYMVRESSLLPQEQQKQSHENVPERDTRREGVNR